MLNNSGPLSKVIHVSLMIVLVVIAFLAISLSNTGYVVAQSQPTSTPTPVPFLYPPFWGSVAGVGSIFDHTVPLYNEGVAQDKITAYNGQQALRSNCPVFPTPVGTPATPTPTPDANGQINCSQIVDGARSGIYWSSTAGRWFSYNGHNGIDYSARYQPIVAAASVVAVERAGWWNPMNHTGSPGSYGLHVVLKHPNSYRTLYGHLSVVDVMVCASCSLPRGYIIGISGNTGHSSGAHLHFSVLKSALPALGGTPVFNPTNVVDPYGWTGGGTPVWAGNQLNSLWVQNPDTNGGWLYPDGEPIENTLTLLGGIPVDDGDPNFVSTGTWTVASENSATNGSMRYAIPVTTGTATASVRWNLPTGSPRGPYKVYVHITVKIIANNATSENAIYEIQSSGGDELDQAIVVQAQYPNTGNPPDWAYIGSYYFYGTGNEYVRLTNLTPNDSALNPRLGADSVMFVPPEDLIFADGFEPNSLYAWSSAVTDGEDLTDSANSAMVGDYGMQANIDDNTGIYVRDETPQAEKRYRARFYFDPNSITMANGDSHYIFSAYDSGSVVVARVQFNCLGPCSAAGGTYRLRVNVADDTTGPNYTDTNWAVISDASHFIEFDWRASTAAGANDGGITVWVDGIQQDNRSGIDNDTRQVDQARLGAISSIDTGTRGIEYFDAFVSRRQTYIGVDDDLIFADSFESGNFSLWSSVTTDVGDASVTAPSAMVGIYGMQAVIDDNNKLYARDESPNAEKRYRARFYFDPNSVSMANGDAHFIFLGTQTGAVDPSVRLEFNCSGGNCPGPGATYRLRVNLPDDPADPTHWTSTSYINVSDATHIIEFDWQAATSSAVHDGRVTLWVDGVEKAQLTGIDNDTRRVDYAQLGTINVDNGTRGTEYFDHFESHRQTYIGPASMASTYYVVTTSKIGRSANFTADSPQYTNETGNLTGVITDMAMDPFNQSVAWVTANSGVWRTANLNVTPPTWTQILTPAQIKTQTGDPYTFVDVSRIVASPNTSGTFFVRANFGAAGPNPNDYVGHTHDNGATWTWVVGTGITGNNNRTTSLTVGPSNEVALGGAIGTGNEGKVWFSNDGGHSFSVIYNSGLDSFHAPVDVFIPQNNNAGAQVIYVIDDDISSGSPNPKLMRTTNGGQNWTNITPAGWAQSSQTGLRIGASTVNRQFLFATDGIRFYYSTDGGTTFAQLFTFASTAKGFSWHDSLFSALTTTDILSSVDGGYTWTSKLGNWASAMGSAFSGPVVVVPGP